MKTMYRVITQDRRGINVTQEEGFKTFEEADQEAKECIERWGQDGQDFWTEPYEVQPPRRERNYAYPKFSRWLGRYVPIRRVKKCG